MKKIVLLCVCVFLLVILYTIISFLKEIGDIPIRQTKDYNTIIINNKLNLADYKIFLEIPKEYDAIDQIDPNTRLKLSNYMKENSLILKDGVQTFNRHNADFNELILDFKFETIQEKNAIDDST